MLNAMVSAGARAMVENTSTDLSLMQVEGRIMPVTRDDGVLGGSYVCSPHSAYAPYARRELELIGRNWWTPLAYAGIAGVDVLLRAARANRIVHLDNWMASTNLHGNWNGSGLAKARRELVERYPDHVIAIRSLDPWSSPHLLAAAEADGWILAPSRQIWVVDDLDREWLPRRNYSNDRRLIARSGLAVEDLDDVTPSDARRISELYRMLYVGRYSALNPQFTPAFIGLSSSTGMISYRTARDAHGLILAVAGMWTRGGITTPAVVGYDTGQGIERGLYRIATWLFMQRAQERGMRLHGSAGAAHFKRLRGARGVIERTAYYVGHLPRTRRLAFSALARALDRFVTPMMQANGW